MRMHRISPEAAAALRGTTNAADEDELEGQEDDRLDLDHLSEGSVGDWHGEHGQPRTPA